MAAPVTALVAGIVILALVLAALDVGGTPAPAAWASIPPAQTPIVPASPDAPPDTSSTPPATPWATPATASAPVTSDPGDMPGIDAPDIPRFPGSVRVAYEEGVDGRITWSLARFQTSATVDEVRAHYRQVFRDHDWLVGDVEFADGAWEFDASRGVREVRVGIGPADGIVQAEVYLSWTTDEAPTPSLTPQPTATPTPTPEPTRRATPRSEPDPTAAPNATRRPTRTQRPSRTERPRRTQRPERPRPTRAPDDDDDDDDDDDEEDDD
jgi:hypothetical protein